MKFFLIKIIIVLIISGCCCSKDKEVTEDKGVSGVKETALVENAETVEIKLPTIQCGTCRKNITKSLKKVEGISEFKISVDDKIAKVSFDKSKTDLAKIETAIVMTGYQANDKPANPEAYEKLDDCCKVDGHD
ncbi:MAG: hypothetical protein HGGPFJEG_00025 [Ignavibacteria bacterium]|nr:hypothetical protein [Ignavibacteria bacterium]